MRSVARVNLKRSVVFSCNPFIMAKTDGQLLSPQAEEELLGGEEDPKRTDSTTGDQDPIYGMIENVNKSLGAMADSLLAMNQSLNRLNSSDTHDQQKSKRRKKNSKDDMSASDGSDDEDSDSDADIRALCATETDISTKEKPRARLEQSDGSNDPLLSEIAEDLSMQMTRARPSRNNWPSSSTTCGLRNYPTQH